MSVLGPGPGFQGRVTHFGELVVYEDKRASECVDKSVLALAATVRNSFPEGAEGGHFLGADNVYDNP